MCHQFALKKEATVWCWSESVTHKCVGVKGKHVDAWIIQVFKIPPQIKDSWVTSLISNSESRNRVLSRVISWAGPSVLEARGCLARLSKSNSNTAPGAMSCGYKRMLESRASALQTLWQWEHASPSFACIQEDLSSLGTPHRAACVWKWASPSNRWKLNSFNLAKWRPLVGDHGGERELEYDSCWVTQPSHVPRGGEEKGAQVLFQGSRGDSCVSSLSLHHNATVGLCSICQA